MLPSASDDDFSSDVSNPAQAGNRTGVPVLVWILGGLGCGCLGLFVLAILVAIALPAFLNQTNRAQLAEAKLNTQALLRAQQAYFLEYSQFTKDLETLGLPISSAGMDFSYEIVPGDDQRRVLVIAKSKDGSLPGLVGAVYVVGDPPTGTVTGVCQSDTLGTTPTEPPTLNTNLQPPAIACPPGASLVASP
jgi:type II secretory pathway pseudopilin PulG